MALFAKACGEDRERLARALAGVRAYQTHPYVRGMAAMPEVARIGGVALRDYSGDGPAVVVVPSLINPPTVLDLAAHNSMLRWLATQGVRPLLVDWGDGLAERALDLGGMVTERLVPLINGLDTRPALAGYCMGGTLALAAATLAPVARLALLATPWRFSGYDDDRRAAVAAHAAATLPLADTLGALPMDLLQPAFWALSPEAVVAKFEAFSRVDAASPAAAAFVALEDWASDGPPLSLPVAREMFALFANDATGTGTWEVGGVPIVPETLGIPILDVVATRDRIVPAATALGLGQRIGIDGGHVGMVVGSRGRALLWEPLARFLRGD